MEQHVVNEKMYPVLSLVIYKTKSEYSGNFYVESRKLEKTDKGIVMHAPAALSEEVFESLTKDFKKHTGATMKHEQVIGANILSASNDPYPEIVWYSPAKKIALNFRPGFLKGTNRITTAWIPACLFCIKKNEMYVYALESDDRPKLDTKLYNAPFLNVYNDGRICLGSAHIGTKKEATYEKEIERFERGFFMAEQNGGHADNRKKKTPLSVLWSQLIKNGKHFPVDELTPHQKVKTVQDILKGRRA